jgi:hypothetical protein
LKRRERKGRKDHRKGSIKETHHNGRQQILPGVIDLLVEWTPTRRSDGAMALNCDGVCDVLGVLCVLCGKTAMWPLRFNKWLRFVGSTHEVLNRSGFEDQLSNCGAS